MNTKLKYTLSKYKQIDLGYQFTAKKIGYFLQEENNVNTASNTVNGNSVFAAYQVNVPKKYLFSVGVRFNKYSSSKTFYTEPRVVLQKFVTPEFSINTSLEYKSQFVSQIEASVINNTAFENNIWANTSAVNLPVLTSYQFSFGGNYTKNNWIIDLEAYFKKTNNISSLNLIANVPANTFEVGVSNVQGIDFFIKKQFNNYHTWFSYTVNTTNYVFENLNNSKRFPSNINIDNTLKWNHFYRYKKVYFALGWVWHSGKPYTKVTSTVDNLGNVSYGYDKLNDSKLPNYHRLDFSVLYDFKIKKNSAVKYRLGLSVLNLYDQKNTLNKTSIISNNQLFNNTIEATQITPNIMFRMFW